MRIRDRDSSRSPNSAPPNYVTPGPLFLNLCRDIIFFCSGIILFRSKNLLIRQFSGFPSNLALANFLDLSIRSVPEVCAEPMRQPLRACLGSSYLLAQEIAHLRFAPVARNSQASGSLRIVELGLRPRARIDVWVRIVRSAPPRWFLRHPIGIPRLRSDSRPGLLSAPPIDSASPHFFLSVWKFDLRQAQISWVWNSRIELRSRARASVAATTSQLLRHVRAVESIVRYAHIDTTHSH